MSTSVQDGDGSQEGVEVAEVVVVADEENPPDAGRSREPRFDRLTAWIVSLASEAIVIEPERIDFERDGVMGTDGVGNLLGKGPRRDDVHDA